MTQPCKYDDLKRRLLQGFEQVRAVGGTDECIEIYALLDFRDDERQRLEDQMRTTDAGLNYNLHIDHPGIFRNLE